MNPAASDSCAAAPSTWVTRWAHLLAAGGAVLDVACGSGRHMQWLAARGHPVTGIDRDEAAVAQARRWGHVIQADIEQGPWPLAGHTFAGVVVTNYLWRPLFPAILQAVAPGGLLLYETFASGQASVGRPARPDFLLRHGELLALCGPPLWRVVAYEDGFLPAPDRFVQRIVALRVPTDAGPATAPQRFPLIPPSAT